MKKLFLSILISLAILVAPVSYSVHIPRAHALFGAGDIVFDPAVYANLIQQFTKLQELYENATDILEADVKGILGKYGLGALSPVMDKFLGGAGLKEILVDEVGGMIGAGGFLEGALSGILNPEDLVSTLLKQFDLKIPSGLFEKLKKTGYFNNEGILGQITGGGGDCVVKDIESLNISKHVLSSRGLDIAVDEVEKLASKCLLDTDTINKDYVPAPKPSITMIPPILSYSCNEWKDGVCVELRTSFGGSGDGKGGGNLTFFDNIPTQFGEIIPRIVQIVLSVAGGIALIMFLIAGYKLISSKGKPETVQAAREQIIAAIVGLLFIIMSFVIFQFIAGDLLRIPGICDKEGDPNCAAPEWNNPAKKQISNEADPQQQCVQKCNTNNAQAEACRVNLENSCRTDLQRGFSRCVDEDMPENCKVKNCANECNTTGGGF